MTERSGRVHVAQVLPTGEEVITTSPVITRDVSTVPTFVEMWFRVSALEPNPGTSGDPPTWRGLSAMGHPCRVWFEEYTP